MASVSIRGVTKAFGATPVLHGVSIEIADGAFTVLVGPSGCGKSTLLRMIAGLEEITAGDLLIDGQRVNDIGPADRGLAMVFQSYALYPHMTVRDNMAFGMKIAKKSKAEIVAEAPQFADHGPASPEATLSDEPVAAIKPKRTRKPATDPAA